MNTALFKKVNETLTERFSLSLLVNAFLVVIVLVQTLYIYNREQIVIDRPMFSQDREMTIVRNKMTRSVAEVWAFNAVTLFGNPSKTNYNLLQAVAFSFLDSDIAKRLEESHKKMITHMEIQGVTIRFIPDPRISYNETTGLVTITGVRIIESVVNPTLEPHREAYEFRVGVSMTGFRPWISEWQEGAVK